MKKIVFSALALGALTIGLSKMNERTATALQEANVLAVAEAPKTIVTIEDPCVMDDLNRCYWAEDDFSAPGIITPWDEI